MSLSRIGRCRTGCRLIASLLLVFAQAPWTHAQGDAGSQDAGPAPLDDATRAVLAAIEANMVPVPAGQFRMGDLAGRGMPDERPVRQVTVAAFRLSKYEVTFEQFDAYARATGKPRAADQGLGRGGQPVINVNWMEAQQFAAWLSAQTGLGYRLPTEAEWEYAARAGSTTEFPWGETFDRERVNGRGRSERDVWEYTAPVGSFAPNPWGLYDMIGNVWEWVQDSYVEGYEDAPTTSVARESDFAIYQRVVRGGSWANDPANLRVSDRSWQSREYRYHFLGFRLARDELAPH